MMKHRLIQQSVQSLTLISSFGESREEAIANLKDAIHLMLEPIPDELLETISSREIVELAL